tara:strand:+ start:229 stop:612 length:384 start_codon:yes stop_codon:yes gene_type:complete
LANTFLGPMLDVTTTDLTTLITVPSADPGASPPVPPTTVVIKSFLVCSDSGSATLLDVQTLRSSATFKQFHQKNIAAGATIDLLNQHDGVVGGTIVLQAGDVLKVQANAANQVHITVAEMEVTKGQL